MTIDPEHEASTWLGMAESMIQRMDFDKAEKALRKAVGVAPKFTKAWIKLGDFLLSQNKVEEARTVFYKAAELDPRLDVAIFDAKLAGKSVEAEVDTSDLLLEAVQAMFDKEMYRARKRLERATEIKPDHAAAWRLLGNARVLDGDVKGAREAHQRAAKLEPWSIKELQLDDEDLTRPADKHLLWDHTELMIRIMMTPSFVEAIELVDKKDQLEDTTLLLELALEEDPFHQEKWREYGAILMLQDRYEDAAKAFGKSLELNIDDHEADFDYTIALYRYGVNNWRYVTEAEAIAFMAVKDSGELEHINRMLKKFLKGYRDPDYFF